MASFGFQFILKLIFQISLAARKLNELVQDQSNILQCHNGPLLYCKISINLIWYGIFKPTQRAIISDFISSLSATPSSITTTHPSVAKWWKTMEKYYHISSRKNTLSLYLGNQILDEAYSLGKSLTNKQIVELASRGEQKNAINVILTSSNVIVVGFCVNRCETHGSGLGSKINGQREKSSNLHTFGLGIEKPNACLGYCTWPFHQPIYRPQSPPLVAPNNDVGLDV